MPQFEPPLRSSLSVAGYVIRTQRTTNSTRHVACGRSRATQRKTNGVAVVSPAPPPAFRVRASQLGPAAFWITNPNNSFVGNLAVDVGGDLPPGLPPAAVTAAVSSAATPHRRQPAVASLGRRPFYHHRNAVLPSRCEL